MFSSSKKGIKFLIDLLVGALTIMSNTSAEVATTNIASWLKFFGVENYPEFLNNPTVNKGISYILIIMFIWITISLINDFIKTYSYKKLHTKLQKLYIQFCTNIIDITSDDNSSNGRILALKTVIEIQNKLQDIDSAAKKSLLREHAYGFLNLPIELKEVKANNIVAYNEQVLKYKLNYLERILKGGT
jgi:hypothetical protein